MRATICIDSPSIPEAAERAINLAPPKGNHAELRPLAVVTFARALAFISAGGGDARLNLRTCPAAVVVAVRVLEKWQQFVVNSSA